MKGKPLIIAIHDFHMPGSMTWSRNGLSDYLYGRRVRRVKDSKVENTIIVEQIKEHSWHGKTIPSGFFYQPETENISAVMFSNAATITKFNRMGKLADLGSKEVKMIREGYLFDPNPNAFDPIHFAVDVDSPEYEESWSDSLIMFHNPNAIIPVNPYCFDDISHTWFDEEKQEFLGKHQPYDVIHSVTFTIISTGVKHLEEREIK